MFGKDFHLTNNVEIEKLSFALCMLHTYQLLSTYELSLKLVHLWITVHKQGQIVASEIIRNRPIILPHRIS